jgi:hypothetical protein
LFQVVEENEKCGKMLSTLLKKFKEVEKMKKFIMVSLILLAIFLSSGSALAWHSGFGRFGIFIAPPPLWVAPPPVYYRGYYPPLSYYGPDYYYNGPYRSWVPGHWESQRTPYGWERVWIPGYWQYGP